MKNIYQFRRLIQKYSRPFKLQRAINKGKPTADDFDDLGNRKAAYQYEESANGAILPVSDRARYESGGRLTESDRTLYSLDHSIPIKSKIMYNGYTYHVESKTPYEDVADFSQYILKAVKGVGE